MNIPSSSEIDKKQFYQAFTLVILGSFLFSSKAILIKLTLPLVPEVIEALALRMIFAIPFYIYIAISSGRKAEKPISLKLYVQIMGLGFLGYYLSSYLDFYGLQYVSAGTERMLIYLFPSFVVILNAIFFKKPIKSFMIKALALTYVGIGLVYIGDADLSHELAWLGVLSVATSAFLFSFFLVWNNHVIQEVGADRFTAHAMIWSCILVETHFVIVGDVSHVLDWSPELLGLGFCLGFLGTVLPSIFINRSIAIIGSDRMAILSMLGPFATLSLGVFILGESVGFIEAVGFALVMLGVFWLKKGSVKSL